MYSSDPDQVLKLIRFSLNPSLRIHFISYGPWLWVGLVT